MPVLKNLYGTQAGAGLQDGSNWANAFDEPAWEAYCEGVVHAPGDVLWLEDCAWLLDSDIIHAVSGTAVDPMAIIGVRAGTTNEPPVFADWARDAADRPFIDGATFSYRCLNYTIIRNIDFQSSNTNALQGGNYVTVENCKLDNDAGVQANKWAVAVGWYSNLINNEIISALCNGGSTSSGCYIANNYIHDILNAIQGVSFRVIDYCTVCFNIFDNNRIHLDGISRDYNKCFNNTFYAGAIGVNNTDGFGWVCINNIMEGQTQDAFLWTVQTDINFVWNNWGNDARCTDMWNLVAILGPYSDYPNAGGLFGDPLLTNPGVDHSLQDTSPCLNTGMSIDDGVG